MPFWKNKKRTELHQAMALLINTSFSLQDQYPDLAGIHEQRGDSRSKRLLPIAIVVDQPELDALEFAVGVTRDISLDGMAVVTTQPIDQDDLVLVIGDPHERKVFRAERVDSGPLSLGCYEVRLRLTSILDSQDAEPFLNQAACLEQETLASC